MGECAEVNNTIWKTHWLFLRALNQISDDPASPRQEEHRHGTTETVHMHSVIHQSQREGTMGTLI